MKNVLFSKVVDFRMAGLAALLLFAACKKNKTQLEPDPPTSGANTTQTLTTNRTELSNDSLFLYAKEVYYWNDALPAYDDFKPRSYGSNYAKELFDITRFKIDPSTTLPYEYRPSSPTIPKYSYIEDINTRNPVLSVPNAQADVDLEGVGNDIGIFAVSPLKVTESTYRLYLLAVDKGSPADLKGLTRGAYLTSINGTAIGTVANFETKERSIINAAIYGDPASITVTAVRTDGTIFSGALTKATYKSSPIFKTNVLTSGAKKVGYLAYARFSNADNSFAELEAAFNDFSTQGVTDLVVDLRYNGGGYINTAEHLINLIAPSTATGTMYSEHFNDLMQRNKATIMKNQPYLTDDGKVQYKSGRMMNYNEDVDYSVARNTHVFEKAGSLKNVTNIVFIVSGNTASASELVINSLKPKMTVKLVGAKTYGKPVGFFPVRIENKYDVFYSMFETLNSKGEGGYFSGMTPDVALNMDYGDYDFGHPEEDLLKAAVAALSSTSKAVSVTSRNKVMSVSADSWSSTAKSVIGKFETNKEFIGMIENRVSPKK